MSPEVRAVQRLIIDENQPADAGSGECQRERRSDGPAAQYGDGCATKLRNARVVITAVNPSGVDALDQVFVGRRAAEQTRVQHVFRDGRRAEAGDERIPAPEDLRSVDDNGRRSGAVFGVRAEHDEHARAGFAR
jgi:hypothetical protein